MAKPTGVSTYTLNILPYLKPLVPTLLTAQSFPDYTCHFIPPGKTPEEGMKGHLSRLQWTQFQLPQIYKQQNANLLFSPLPEIPLFSDCRSVVMMHDLIPVRFPKRFSLLTPYYRYYIPSVLRQAEHIICNSVATAADITNFLHISSHKITPILLSHDTNHFQFLDLPTQNYFLYLGRCEPYKNLHRLISAFASLPGHGEQELWLAGPIDRRYQPQLVRQITALNLSHHIKFLNYIPYTELPKLLNQAIALVFPSLWEGFGLPVLEAMACGTSVITSNLASMPEVAGDAALLVDPYRVESIADAMAQVAADSQLRATLRQRGLARAQQFSWEKTGKATAEVLQRFM